MSRSYFTTPAVALALLGFAALPPATGSARADDDPAGVEAVPPIPAIESAVTLANGPRYETATNGVVYSPLDEPAFIGGHDNGQSTLYDNGRGLRFSYWSFGDTFLTTPNGDGKRFLANTGALTTDFNLADSISGWWYDGDASGPREFLKLNATEQAWNTQHADANPSAAGCQPKPGVAWMQCGDERALWGGAIVADPAWQRILAFYSLIRRYHYRRDVRPGTTIPCTDADIANRVEACRGFTFDGVGVGVSVWTEDTSDGDGWARQTVANPTNPANPTAIWPFDADPDTFDPRFDTGMLIDGGYLYAYGCYGLLSSQCRLARVPLSPANAVWNRAAWRFFAGPDRDTGACPDLWSAALACAVPLRSGTTTLNGGAAGTSVFWNPALGVFMAIHSVPLSNEIRYRVAYRPEGPWSAETHLTTALPAAGSELGSVSYAGFAHPEYAEQNGLVQYITYAHTTGAFSSDFPVLKVTFAGGTG